MTRDMLYRCVQGHVEMMGLRIFGMPECVETNLIENGVPQDIAHELSQNLYTVHVDICRVITDAYKKMEQHDGSNDEQRRSH